MAIALKLNNFPVVIEPVVQVLELKVSPLSDMASGGGEPCWQQLYRIPVEDIAAIAPVPCQAVHWFGPSHLLSGCPFAIGYTSAGVLSSALVQGAERWELVAIPAEITGQAELRPSFRFIFKNERARSLFQLYFQQVLDGRQHNPTLVSLLEQLDEGTYSGYTGVLRRKASD